MKFFSSTEAPPVHIELLPDSAHAIDVYTSLNMLTIKAWAPGSPIPCTGESELSFINNYCHQCEFYCSEIDVDLEGRELSTSHGELYCVDPSVRFASPCSAYDEGVDSISFPCTAGYNGPQSEPTDQKLSAEYMVYGRTYDLTNDFFHKDYVAIQAAVVNRNSVYLTDALSAINTYHDDSHVCWGETNVPANLLEAEATFTTSFANEDLCSFDTHINNATDVESYVDDENYELCSSAITLPTTTRPQALVAAAITSMPNAFVLLGSSGCHINKNVVYIPVCLYSDVAIDEDTVSNVWVTEVLPSINKRLMFVYFDNEHTFTNAVYLGQIDSNFNLQPCKLTLPQSSEPEARDNNLSPA
jgi:hypothetical protein